MNYKIIKFLFTILKNSIGALLIAIGHIFTFNSYCDAIIRQQLELKACKAAAVCGKPIFIFREIMNYLYEHHIVIPGYSYMQETVVGKAITYEQNRLTTLPQNQLNQSNIRL